jgi:hypothetical protein
VNDKDDDNERVVCDKDDDNECVVFDNDDANGDDDDDSDNVLHGNDGDVKNAVCDDDDKAVCDNRNEDDVTNVVCYESGEQVVCEFSLVARKAGSDGEEGSGGDGYNGEVNINKQRIEHDDDGGGGNGNNCELKIYSEIIKSDDGGGGDDDNCELNIDNERREGDDDGGGEDGYDCKVNNDNPRGAVVLANVVVCNQTTVNSLGQRVDLIQDVDTTCNSDGVVFLPERPVPAVQPGLTACLCTVRFADGVPVLGWHAKQCGLCLGQGVIAATAIRGQPIPDELSNGLGNGNNGNDDDGGGGLDDFDDCVNRLVNDDFDDDNNFIDIVNNEDHADTVTENENDVDGLGIDVSHDLDSAGNDDSIMIDSLNDDSVCSQIEFDGLTVRCLSLNVCGLKSRLLFPEFIELICKHDIICLVETKLEDIDVVKINGFTCFMKNRRKYISRSGGIALLIRNDFLPYIRVIENRGFAPRVDHSILQHYKFVDHFVVENALLFEFCHKNSRQVESFLGAIVYLPPEGSVYVNRQGFQELEETLACLNFQKLLLFGDFNARTGNLADFVVFGENEQNGITCTFVDQFDVHNIQQTRLSMDNQVNSFGNAMLDFCISQNVLICNGRVGDDAVHGKLTCKNASVVDYVIVSPCVFENICHFSVGGFDTCFSDVHCPLFFTLRFDLHNEVDGTVITDEECEQLSSNLSKPTWKAELKDVFIDNVKDGELNNLRNEIDFLLQNVDNVLQSDIDIKTGAFVDILLNAAVKSGMVSDKSRRHNKRKQTASKLPWFDNDCKNKRKRLRLLKNAVGKDKNNNVLQEQMKNACREYKNSVKRKARQHRLHAQAKFRNLRTSDPKEYWKALNRAEGLDNVSSQNIPSHEEFVEYFHNLSNVTEEDLLQSPDIENIRAENLNNESLNNNITIDEVLKGIKKLKNNKACGYDRVLNEFLKAASRKIVDVVCLLFNLILKSGRVPDVWTVGFVCPLYKGSGDCKNVDNYRGITILSCLGKLFTSILNERLYMFLDDNKLLGKEQAGFRKGNSTIDHIFALHSLVDLYLQKKKRLFCTFVDFKKCFDNVQHVILWEKLLSLQINGNILLVIKDLYAKAKSCVKTAKGLSAFYTCNVGLRQGENLSPLLCSIFLNDLKPFLIDMAQGLNLVKNVVDDLCLENIEDYLYLFVLLYADDTVILAETEQHMQRALDALHKYCLINGVKVNTSKTKIVIFSRGKVRKIPNFVLGTEKIEVTFEYKYLGTMFSYNNKFFRAIKCQYNAASRAMFSLLRKCNKLDLPLDIQLDLFKKCVVPVLLYGCEVWGFQDLSLCDKLQLRFFKILLRLKSNTSSCMVYGELGEFPVSLEVKTRLLCFWYRLCLDSYVNPDKLSVLMLRLHETNFAVSTLKSQWLTFVHDCLHENGLGYIWLHVQHRHLFLTIDQFKNLVKQRMRDQFFQQWSSDVHNNNVCITYRLFKESLCFENYLLKLSPVLANSMVKFRCSNHRLPVQQLRYSNVPREDRVCNLCSMNEIGDEMHYVLICPHPDLLNARRMLLPKFYLQHPNVLKLNNLFSTQSLVLLRRLARFIRVIMQLVN